MREETNSREINRSKETEKVCDRRNGISLKGFHALLIRLIQLLFTGQNES